MAESSHVAGWPQGATLVVQAVLPTMGAMLLVPALPLLQQHFSSLNHSEYWLPALLTVPGLCIALFAIVAGYLGDKLGRRRLLIIALSVYGFAGLAPIALNGFEEIFAARILLGVCEAFIITLSATLIGDYFSGAARERWLSLISTTATLSVILLLLSGGVLAKIFGWWGPFLLYGIALLFIPAMIKLTWEPDVRSEQTNGIAKAAFPWLHMAKAGVVTLLGSSLFYTLAIQQGVGLAALGVTDPAKLGLMTALASLGNPIGALLFPRVSRIGLHFLLTCAFGLMGLAFVAMSFCKTGEAFCASTFFGLMGAGLLMPTLITWTMAGLPAVFRGRGIGVFQSLFALGQFGSGLILPALVQLSRGAVLPAFGQLGFVAIASAAAALLLAIFQRRNRYAAHLGA